MSRGHKRPKKNLRFSILLEVLQNTFKEINDKRDQNKINYQINDIYTAAFALFYFQDKSLLEFQRQMEIKYRLCNLKTVYNIKDIPKDSQLRDVIDKLKTLNVPRYDGNNYVCIASTNSIRGLYDYFESLHTIVF